MQLIKLTNEETYTAVLNKLKTELILTYINLRVLNDASQLISVELLLSLLSDVLIKYRN